MGEAVKITPTCSIDADELTWRFTASGGPGGQHANTANTRVELVFDIQHSTSLGPRQKERLLTNVGAVVRVVATDERSQARNRDIALDRLRARLADGLKVVKKRHPTKPSRGAKERRLQDKARRSARKHERRASPDPD
ncbi:MAG TPA: alternative ribosome rescue aminoacyl-tRNA hydrolase ArfB [Acidimicrobiales bacterium]|nr:alternative ribosome rescue aminoacyl-tRNA hydrolase ArfB [Acidimicrobiales bacterium]